MAKKQRPQDAERRARRAERQQAAASARRREHQRRRLRNVAITLAGAIVVLAVGYVIIRPDPEVAGVTKPASRGRGHVAAASFDSPTPTSGRHSASAPPCGSTTQALPPELAVHALEHGTVLVWYRPDIEDDVRLAARDVLSEWDSHWILAPNPRIDRPLVATAWNRLKPFDEAGDDLREFVDTYRRRGPERVDCPV